MRSSNIVREINSYVSPQLSVPDKNTLDILAVEEDERTHQGRNGMSRNQAWR
jgi:hypothetical protein